MGMANRFKVEVGGVQLGHWSKCDGLSVEFAPFEMLAGGDYNGKHYLPGQVNYPRITLTRSMSKKDSATLKSWLADKADELNDAGGNLAYSDGTGKITLLDAHGEEVISWTLRGVHPNAWHGPSFDASAAKVAVETLELVHEGFL